MGTRTRQVKLPASITYIAPDAFERYSSFEVVPDTYAEKWCRNNGFFCEDMRVFIDKEQASCYEGIPVELKAQCTYPDHVEYYRWERSDDRMNWRVVEDVQGDSLQVSCVEGRKETYVRCRASVGGVLLQSANYATV